MCKYYDSKWSIKGALLKTFMCHNMAYSTNTSHKITQEVEFLYKVKYPYLEYNYMINSFVFNIDYP